MALVLLLKGVNVGGHKTFRPTLLAKELAPFDVVNIGAAGTFVIRAKVSHLTIRQAVMRRLPFITDVMICNGADILRLLSRDPFAGLRSAPDVVRFVSVLASPRKPISPLPVNIPASGDWGVRILSQEGRLVCGIYRRQMKAITYLGQLEKVFGVPATTRNWNTIQAVARTLTARV